MSYRKDVGIAEMLGQTIAGIDGKPGDDELVFRMADGRVYKMFHDQDCCESVYLEDVCGDLDDLIGSPIVMAECETNSDDPVPINTDSFTWTFYKLGTAKGSVTLRWFGESNGYYSEEVTFALIDMKDSHN